MDLNLNLNAIFGAKTKKKKRVKRRTISKSKSTNSPGGGTGAPKVVNGQFAFPTTFKVKTPSPPKTPSKHDSYLTSGKIGAEEIRRRIQGFIDSFFISHKGTPLTVDNLVNHDSVDILLFMKPLAADEKGRARDIIGAGGFGNALQHEDPTKIIKEIKFYDKWSRMFNVQPADIIAELLIQYILQVDTEHPSMVPAIHAIYYDKTKDAIWIVMDKLDKTVDALFESEATETGYVGLRTFKNIVSQILEMLIYLNDAYGFVHRDLKGDNTMIKSETVMKKTLRGKNKEEVINRVKLIDFGFSAMNFEGLRLGSTHTFKNNSPCRGRQDTTFLFVYFNGMRGIFDSKVQRFLNEILEPISRVKSWAFAYNRDGKLLACPSTRILNPTKALRLLQGFV